MEMKEITQEQLELIGYEFYKFYTVFKPELLENYSIDIERDIEEDHREFMQFPLYCFTAFIKSFTDYQDEIH